MSDERNINYYGKSLIRSMNEFERIKKKCMHEFNPELERRIWEAIDAKSLAKMQPLLNEIRTEIDSAKSYTKGSK